MSSFEASGQHPADLELFLSPDFVQHELRFFLDQLLIQKRRELQRLQERHGSSTDAAWELFDERLRSLSEMPLCDFWYENPVRAVPHGFVVHEGTLFVDGTVLGTDDYHERHVFAHRGSEILCPTFGQFLWPKKREMKAGERVSYLYRTAPDLVRLYDNGLAVLFGKQGDIRAKYGFDYRIQS